MTQAQVRPVPASRAAQRFAALESIRGFAAAYVLAGHICNVYLHNPAWALPLRFASEAVILFFLLSGFVVRHATRDDSTVADFFGKRIRRIYPLFVISLGFSYAVACADAGELVPVLWPILVGNLLMLQDFSLGRPGVWVTQYYNEALWSLAYEWWFYVFFIAMLKLPLSPVRRNALVLAAAILAMLVHVAAPNPFSYFLAHFAIWWAAAEVARHHRSGSRLDPWRVLPWCGALLLLCAGWIPALLDTPSFARSPGLYPILDMRHFAAAAMFLAIGLVWQRHWQQGGARLFDWTFGPFKALAPMSYGIYIFHFPIVTFFAHSPWADHPLACVPAIIATTLVVAYIAEVRLQAWINRWPLWRRFSPGM